MNGVQRAAMMLANRKGQFDRGSVKLSLGALEELFNGFNTKAVKEVSHLGNRARLVLTNGTVLVVGL